MGGEFGGDTFSTSLKTGVVASLETDRASYFHVMEASCSAFLSHNILSSFPGIITFPPGKERPT